MTAAFAELGSRALVKLAGADWRTFLQGLVSNDVETLAPGAIRFAGLLTPQGRLLFDLFVTGGEDGCLLDVQAARRDELVQRLLIYRLRARVEIAPEPGRVCALWNIAAAPGGWAPDPRLDALGFRGRDLSPPEGAARLDEPAYDSFRLTVGVPDPARDALPDKTYPIEADFDLLNGIDFKKGCFVGQETTSRMKRRGGIRSRMLPIVFEGAPPPVGAEVLAGELRAGEVLTGVEGRAMALLRLDRIANAELTVDGRPVRVARPDWAPDEA
jgi:folate-binding protein YgfZ